MENMRWLNPGHPQTLHIGVILLYIDAVFSLLGTGLSGGLGLLFAVGLGAAGFGIANDKRIAWYVGVALSAILPVLLLGAALTDGLGTLFDTRVVLNAIFPIAQFVALIHPMSRSYIKVFFE